MCPRAKSAIAIILPSPTEASIAVLADVTGHEKQAAELIKKINDNMAARKAVKKVRTVQGTEVTHFNIPKHEEEAAGEVAYFLKHDLLVAADNFKVIEGIVARHAETKTDSLAKVTAYDAIPEARAQGGRRAGAPRPLVHRAVWPGRRHADHQRPAPQARQRHAQDPRATRASRPSRGSAASSTSRSSSTRSCTARSSMPRAIPRRANGSRCRPA